MKRLFAIFAAFVIVASAGATFNIVQAGSSHAPDLTTTPSSTFTLTPTETSENPSATPTATEELCQPPPPAPKLIAPKQQAVIKNKTRIKLRWEEVTCADKYRIVVRRGSVDGDAVVIAKTHQVKAFVELERGYSYFWYVKACIKKQCGRSKTKRFNLPPPPTPTPTATPTVTNTPKWTNTPRPGNPGGTPVPGNPPSKLNEYKGPSVYLNSNPSPLYYFDCGPNKYPYYPKGFQVYTLALWFYPNESVNWESRTLPGLLVDKGILKANSEGIVEITFDTSSWPGEHYHMTFYGQSSKVSYCGHIQVTDFGAAPLPPAHGPHTQEELLGSPGAGNPTQ